MLKQLSAEDITLSSYSSDYEIQQNMTFFFERLF